jgi:transposase
MSEGVPAAPRTRAAIRQSWIERLDRFAASSLSVVAFCRREGISCHAFYYWKHKLAAEPAASANGAPRLLPVRLLPQPSPIEVALPQGPVLRVVPGCDLAFVRSLVDTLGGAPC